jgi:TRAP-type C4-dicarboxylate transport system permease small subunit
MAVLAFGVALVVSVVVVVAAAVFSIALAVGGEDATSDNWVGALAATGLIGGVLVSLGAFVVAAVAWVSHERTRLLWLPLLLFPALLALVVLGEAFWWE